MIGPGTLLTMNDSGPASALSKETGQTLFAGPELATAALVLADGTAFLGRGLGATGRAVGEVCFNTSMTGYQEILSDPSYAGQIITFTFPHIGNIGANPEDIETATPAARGLVLRADITEPSNWRAVQGLDAWLKSHNLIAIAGIDTRALTCRIRDLGAPEGCLGHDPEAPTRGGLDLAALRAEAAAWPGLAGMDLAKEVTCTQAYGWDETRWSLESGYGRQEAPKHHVVAVDFGAKRNILRCLATLGCRVTVVPATATAEEILRHRPDGVFLSNGPGDPAATGAYAVPTVKALLGEPELPIFGICLGHQILALAFGRDDPQDAFGPPGRQSSGEGPGQRPGRDHQPEPRLRSRPGEPAAGGGAKPRVAVRRLQRGHCPERPAGVFRAIPSGSLPRAPRQPLPLRALRRQNRGLQGRPLTPD